MPRIRPLSALVAVALLTSLAVATPATGANEKRSYIVVLKQDVAAPTVAAKHARKFGTSLKHVYRHSIKGYAAKLSAADVAALRSDPAVRFVERDGIARIAKAPRTSGRAKARKPRNPSTTASWGLDRIDQRARPLSGTFNTTATGNGVTAYVVDTGIRITHQQFGSRAVYGTDTVDGDGIASDCNGHGTHVAGTIGGSSYGVARQVRLVAVRVLGCGGSGTWSGVIAGVDWAVGHHETGPAVMNLSLGGGRNSAVDAAVERAVADGITVAVAAGNSSTDACTQSPAAAPDALTVGATTNTTNDARASYSNFGSCLDVFAPGSSIPSAWSTSDTATNTISGTSMASPHVAGVAALYLSVSGNGSKTPQQVGGALTAEATSGIVGGAGAGSPNLLLYTNR